MEPNTELETVTKKRYLNIPSDVLQNSEFSSSVKIIFSEIISLSKQKGYCWSANEHFSELCGIHPTTASNAIGFLRKKGYVKTFVNKANGNSRKIYVQRIEQYRYTLPVFTLDPQSNLLIGTSIFHIPYKQIKKTLLANHLQISTRNNTLIITKKSTATTTLNIKEKNNSVPELKIALPEKIKEEAEPATTDLVNENTPVNELDIYPTPPDIPNRPTLQEVVDYFASNGINNRLEAETWYDKMEALCWQNQKGEQIRNWKKYLDKKFADRNQPIQAVTQENPLLVSIVDYILQERKKECGVTHNGYEKVLLELLKEVKSKFVYISDNLLQEHIIVRKQYIRDYSIEDLTYVLMTSMEDHIAFDNEPLPF